MGDGSRDFPPLRAGRRPAGLALLGWLDDDRAPRLCTVTGAPGAGKSHLLAWLGEGCGPDGAPDTRRIDLLLPAEGLTVRSAVWLLGRQLHTVARTPQDVVAALAAEERRTVLCVPQLNRAVEPDRLVAELLDPLLRLSHVRLLVEAPAEVAFDAVPDPAVLDLDDPRWTDRERFAAWCAGQEADPEAYPNPARALGTAPAAPTRLFELLDEVPDGPGGAPDLPAAGAELLSGLWSAAAREGGFGPLLVDPLLYVLPSPTAVTAGLEGADHPIARAWDAAGPALIDTPKAPGRAQVLRARLLGTDDSGRAAADRLAGAPSPWTARWARWEPLPAVAAAPYGDLWLTADATGAVHTLAPATGEAVGRVAVPGPKPLRGLAVTASGALVLLDALGGTELVAPAEPAPGLEPAALEEALTELRGAATGEITAVAAAPGLGGAAPAVGDASGGVHRHRNGEVVSERPHSGPVTALAAVARPGTDGADGPQGGDPLLVSGGKDGTVRLWGPAAAPAAEPVDRGPGPVTAVAADAGPAGLLVAAAWADGLIRVRRPFAAPADEAVELRLGSPVRALALSGEALLVGLEDGLLTLELHRA